MKKDCYVLPNRNSCARESSLNVYSQIAHGKTLAGIRGESAKIARQTASEGFALPMQGLSCDYIGEHATFLLKRTHQRIQASTNHVQSADCEATPPHKIATLHMAQGLKDSWSKARVSKPFRVTRVTANKNIPYP